MLVAQDKCYKDVRCYGSNSLSSFLCL